jgi:hypothetical protein
MALYPPTSPYFTTDIVNGQFLDIMTNRQIISDPSDVYWQITPVYNLRPDLLAYDLYNDSRLWWVFAQRNPNKLKDPLFDFVQGASIYIPKLEFLKSSLGI